MRVKLFALFLTSCLAILAQANAAQAQLFPRFGGRGFFLGAGNGAYYYPYSPGYYGPSYSSGPAYYGWGNRYYAAPIYGGYSAYPYTPAPLIDPSITSAPITSSDVVAAPMRTNTLQSFYAAPAMARDRIEFHVKAPAADAKVFFNDRLVEQQGSDRMLTTPPLAAGVYRYNVRAIWMENGREVTQSRDVLGRPGEALTIDFIKNANVR